MPKHSNKYLPAHPFSLEDMGRARGADWSFFFLAKLWAQCKPAFLIRGEWLTKMDARVEKEYLSEFVAEMMNDVENSLLREMNKRLNRARMDYVCHTTTTASKEAFFQKFARSENDRYCEARRIAGLRISELEGQGRYINKEELTPIPYVFTLPEKALKKFLTEPPDQEMADFWLPFFQEYRTAGKAEFIARFKSKFLTLFKKELWDRQLKREVWLEYVKQENLGNPKITFNINGISLLDILPFLFDDYF